MILKHRIYQPMGGHNNRAFKGTDQSNQGQNFNTKDWRSFMCRIKTDSLFYCRVIGSSSIVMPSNWVMTKCNQNVRLTDAQKFIVGFEMRHGRNKEKNTKIGEGLR